MRLSVNTIFNNIGCPIGIKYYTQTFISGGSYYDDAVTLAQSGTTLWTSGYRKGLDSKGEDPFLIERGLLLEKDSKLYLPGTVQTNGILKIGLGSPGTEFFSTIQVGPQHAEFTENPVFKIVYMRYLPTGSLAGEQ